MLAGSADAKYQFRQASRALNKTISTWVDQDESGTYDPTRKIILPPPIPKKRLTSLEGSGQGVDTIRPKRAKISTWLNGRRIGKSLVVILKVKSDAGKALLRHFPDESTESESQQEDSPPFTSLWSASGGSFSTDLNSPFTQSHNHSRDSQIERQISTDSLSSFSHLDSTRLYKTDSVLYKFGPNSGSRRFLRPSIKASGAAADNEKSINELTLGHPEARGCRACLELRQSCPLLEEDSNYPCYFCVEDDCDCELIVPPVKRATCEGCRRRRISCSYNNGGDHSFPCERCQTLGQNCVAGPETGSLRIGYSLGQGPSFDERGTFVPTSARPYLTCAPCRRAKKWCSLSDKTKKPPCKLCKMQGTSCTFEKLQRNAKDCCGKFPEGNVENSNCATSAIPPEDQTYLSGGGTRVIKTSFAHPVSFNYEPPENGSDPCDWCHDLAFGLLGIGEARRVEVIDYGDGKGLTEIDGGYTGEGKEPSKMCLLCTTERLRILSCGAHEVQPISGLSLETFDFDAAYEELLSTDPVAGRNRPLTKWCSICPCPAFFKCCTLQATDRFGQPMNSTSDGAAGCGLHMCEHCAVSLSTCHGGDLGTMLRSAEENPDDYPGGLRADAALYLPERELLQQVLGGGVEEDVDANP
ncbi:MAG: hypothetical protein M1827_005119 [Pycnora praestabilis]|nr:MAG: hypothetical protein M1827_005119 [Pycnora praestabilis]